ncbi:hypothetical protein EXIGLDRAFT_727550 [Exidia glandulosa HHB12029]|uniref:NADH dehydrogenase [ubiquinone] iron-sulfur protein 5 n=1 Tax=Exidia glandulosa HHB12029 TaxID=1314781 RepID=A0A165DC27_EXIGL|nr:hypothetical protein EXIGLDRAFT_727550 [Exidia glandulosa HHB12029]
MASGYGYSGGRGRCYPYWQEVIKCYQSVGEPSECRLQADDYLECLHHRKEIARAKLIQSEFIKHAAHLDREAQKGADIAQGGAVATVGLIDKSSSSGK